MVGAGCAILTALGGCADAGGRGESARRLVAAEPALAKQRFSALLDFENPSDLLFLNAPGVVPRVDTTTAHSGQASVALDAGTKLLYVDLPTLLRGREFPGQWTLA